MLKLLATTLLLSSLSYAGDASKKVESFLLKNAKAKQGIESIKVKVTRIVPVPGKKEWSAYFVTLSAVITKAKRNVSQDMVWFSDGNVIAQDVFDLDKGFDFKDETFSFEDKYYTKANLIYGNENAKHKVVIFSDPLCPFCKNFVPKAIKYMKKQPNKFAVYYFHFPLPNLHPAAVGLVKCATALEFKGRKNVVLDLYTVKINAKETKPKVILDAFNKTMKSNITLKEMNSLEVLQHVKRDLDIADAVMVGGTPTMFFDGKLDKSKNKYKTVK